MRGWGGAGAAAWPRVLQSGGTPWGRRPAPLPAPSYHNQPMPTPPSPVSAPPSPHLQAPSLLPGSPSQPLCYTPFLSTEPPSAPPQSQPTPPPLQRSSPPCLETHPHPHAPGSNPACTNPPMTQGPTISLHPLSPDALSPHVSHSPRMSPTTLPLRSKLLPPTNPIRPSHPHPAAPQNRHPSSSLCVLSAQCKPHPPGPSLPFPTRVLAPPPPQPQPPPTSASPGPASPHTPGLRPGPPLPHT